MTLLIKCFVKMLVSIVLISVVNIHHILHLLMGRDKKTREDYSQSTQFEDMMIEEDRARS